MKSRTCSQHVRVAEAVACTLAGAFVEPPSLDLTGPVPTIRGASHRALSYTTPQVLPPDETLALEAEVRIASQLNWRAEPLARGDRTVKSPLDG